MSSSAEDLPETEENHDDVSAAPRAVGRWASIRAARPRLAHGLLGILALAMAAGAWAGLAFGPDDADPDTSQVAQTSVDERWMDDSISRDKARPEPTDTETSTKEEPEPPVEPEEVKVEPESQETQLAAPASCDDFSGNQLTACALLGDFGMGTDQMSCLVPLWDHESGWNEAAMNPSSGAYGIPQALPGDKMASAGSDWQSNAATQIKWGLGYIGDRYGDPCGAWSFWQSNNWY